MGAIDVALQGSVAYAKERHTFGRPIGSYQGVSHPLADAIVEVHCARLLIWRGIAGIAEGAKNAGETLSAAAWFAGRAAEKAVSCSLHTFGGYGLTVEYDIHLYNLRAKALLRQRGVEHIDEIRVDLDPAQRDHMVRVTGRRTVPQIFIGETHVGGCDDLYALDRSGKLETLLSP